MSEIIFTSEITVKLIQSMGGDAAIAAAARVSTQGAASQADKTDDEIGGLLNFLMKHRHGSPFECSAMTFLVHAPAFVWWEWVRHRIGHSYSLESSRYKQLEPVFWIPRASRKMTPAADHKSARPHFVEADTERYDTTLMGLKFAYSNAWTSYKMMLEIGIAKEVARACLPFAVYFSGYVTVNPRSLMAYLSLRVHEPSAKFVSYPQAEIEEAARECEAILMQHWPLTYRAFVANGRVGP